MGVVVRKHIDFLIILLIPTPLVVVFFPFLCTCVCVKYKKLCGTSMLELEYIGNLLTI